MFAKREDDLGMALVGFCLSHNNNICHILIFPLSAVWANAHTPSQHKTHTHVAHHQQRDQSSFFRLDLLELRYGWVVRSILAKS
jgi:hypothetical protein